MTFPRDRLLRKGDYIDGSFLKPERVDGYINDVNPGDRADVLGRFPFSAASVDDAVTSATRGAARWRAVPLLERIAVVRRLREQLGAHAEPLARLSSRENGKPLWEARQELQAAQRAVEIYLEEAASALASRTLPDVAGRADYLPRGVVGMVLPYTHPFLHGAAMSAAALLAGNAVVLKPSKFSPGSGQAIAECWDRCRLPRGVFNLVQGSGSVVGQRLVAHPGLDALVFTGSYESAREVRRATVDRPELPAIYQCGGKGMAIVLAGGLDDHAVYELLVGAFLTTGQRHTSTARVLVHASVHDALADDLVRRATRLVVGYGAEADTFMGPLVSENLRARYRSYARALSARGHTLLLPPRELADAGGRRGNYVTPTIVSVDWVRGSPFLNDEPPGPTLLLYRFESLDEAVALHEQAQFRGVTSVFARPDDPALSELRLRLRTGALNVNRGTLGTSLRLPSMGLGRASNGIAAGPDLLRALAAPRATLTDAGGFDPANLVPGVRWSDDEDTDLGGALEPAAE